MQENNYEVESDKNINESELNFEDDSSLEQSYGKPTLKESVFSVLFVSTKLVSISELVQVTKSSQEEVEEVLAELTSEIEQLGLGVEIKSIGDSFQIRTLPKMSKVLHRMITPKMKRLSKAAAETLAVIAYKQPVSKAEIEAIRGVDALPTLKTLLDGRLIRIVGREDSPGSPALYGTSSFFLERFGLKDLSELPTVREIKELDSELSEIQVESFEASEEEDGQIESDQHNDAMLDESI